MLRILGSIKFCKRPVKISNGQLKFGNLHIFEWVMGHWPILRADHHFGLGLSLLWACETVNNSLNCLTFSYTISWASICSLTFHRKFLWFFSPGAFCWSQLFRNCWNRATGSDLRKFLVCGFSDLRKMTEKNKTIYLHFRSNLLMNL